jgi:hypothetical protein
VREIGGRYSEGRAKHLLDQSVHQQPPAAMGKLDPLVILRWDRAGQFETGAFVHAAIGRR